MATVSKKLIERSKVYHNHKPLATLDTKRKIKIKTNTHAQNKQSSFFPKRSYQNAKTNKETKSKSKRKTLKHKARRDIFIKLYRIKNNFGTAALERPVTLSINLHSVQTETKKKYNV